VVLVASPVEAGALGGDLDPSFDADPLEPAGATVLSWPGPRRPGGDSFDDPELPGGA